MIKISLLICILGLVAGIYAQETTRFMVVADPHNYSPVSNFEETIFFEIVLAAIEEKVDFMFFPGDLVIRGFGEYTEKDSVLKDWRFVLDTLSTHDIRVFACRGNNDFSKEAWDSLFIGKYSFPKNGPENEKNITYAIDYNNILFIALDQYTDSHRINQIWLDSILTNNKKPHIFAAGHEPAFKFINNGCMGIYPESRNIFWESLVTSGTKIFFSGHDHFYAHSIINDYNGDPDNDIHQVIVGTGSSLHQEGAYNGDNGRWTPDSIFHERKNGYVLVEVEGEEVQFTWKHRIEPNVFEYGDDSYTFVTTSLQHQTVSNTFKLNQNYPNPFNPNTVISWQLAVDGQVELSIYNILSQKILTLVSEWQKSGYHDVEWDARGYASGIYMYRIDAGTFVKTKKLVLIK